MKKHILVYILTVIGLSLSINVLCKNYDQFESSPIQKTNSMSNDSCDYKKRIKTIIKEYINGESESIFEDEFLSYFTKINKKHNHCSFPHELEDVRLYFELSDSCLISNSAHDIRAVKLAIKLYLLNKNNVEVTEHFSCCVIPKIALTNINFFIETMYELNENDANRCIRKLKYIRKHCEVHEILQQLENIKEKRYLKYIDKIKAVLNK